ncbi:MAG: hypothetical protein WB586_02055 [Chthoniobacterales bacterium]
MDCIKDIVIEVVRCGISKLGRWYGDSPARSAQAGTKIDLDVAWLIIDHISTCV